MRFGKRSLERFKLDRLQKIMESETETSVSGSLPSAYAITYSHLCRISEKKLHGAESFFLGGY